jgi:hypothetical protein
VQQHAHALEAVRRSSSKPADITLDCCIRAARSRARDPRAAPFLNSFAFRALRQDGVARHAPLSRVARSATDHVQRHRVEVATGEVAVLTFSVLQQDTVRAAYRGLASEAAWVLARVAGEYDAAELRVRSLGRRWCLCCCCCSRAAQERLQCLPCASSAGWQSSAWRAS